MIKFTPRDLVQYEGFAYILLHLRVVLEGDRLKSGTLVVVFIPCLPIFINNRF